MSLVPQYKSVNQRIQIARKGHAIKTDVRLLAVSKKHSADAIHEIYQLGHRDFAESYVQEAVEKIELLKEDAICWHFIGPIQSNKTRQIASHFDWVQSIDRIKILKRINAQRPKNLKPINALLQLKIGDETTKSGASITELTEMLAVSSGLENLRVRDLMCIPPASQDFAQQSDYFQQAFYVYQQFKKTYAFDTLSMGMSNDLEAAVANGSNMLRIGTDIFGKRS